MRVTTIRFNLKFFNANGGEEVVRTLDELRSKFNLSGLCEYFRDGNLSRWLRSVGESKIADSVDALRDVSDHCQSFHRLCSLLRLAIDKKSLTKFCSDWGCPARRRKLNSITTVVKRKGKQEIPKSSRGDIYCGNLAYVTTESDLRTAFEEFGTVTSACVVTDCKTGCSKGFGFVVMQNRTQAQAAIDVLNGKVLDGRQIRVSWSNHDSTARMRRRR